MRTLVGVDGKPLTKAEKKARHKEQKRKHYREKQKPKVQAAAAAKRQKKQEEQVLAPSVPLFASGSPSHSTCSPQPFDPVYVCSLTPCPKAAQLQLEGPSSLRSVA